MAEFFVRYADTTQILLFAGMVSVLWLVEGMVMARPEGGKLGRTMVNAGFILSALPIEIGLSMVCMAASSWVTTHHIGIVHLLPYASSPWIKYGLLFVALDLLDYVYHLTVHHVSVFWRFHLVHHTDQMVDSSTTVREHPGETVIRSSFLVLWTLLLGASFEVLLMRQAADTVTTIFAHSAFRLPPRVARVLGWVFITPNLHHVHHHFELPYTNCNYGGAFSIWDRMFGTYAELPAEKTVFGLDTHMEPVASRRFSQLIAMPFKACASAMIPASAPALATAVPKVG